MIKPSIHKIMLAQYARRVYIAAGQINLYIQLCYEEDSPDTKRLESELETIKTLVADIEMEIASV